jgi:hypothetical protein
MPELKKKAASCGVLPVRAEVAGWSAGRSVDARNGRLNSPFVNNTLIRIFE